MRLQVLLSALTNLPRTKKHHPDTVKAIAAWIYAILARSSKGYSDSMHDHGLRVPNCAKKVTKPFCFSRIYETPRSLAINITSPDPKVPLSFSAGRQGERNASAVACIA